MPLDAPLLTAEFLAVDTETNGLPRERCELTEVGAVLVGGGELHERWSSLVGVSAPLSAGIQRFTGITQAMVDAAPPAEAVLPQLAARLRGRVLVAHSARFDVGVLRAAFARAGLDWPDPPVLCTVALARRLAPLQRRRGLAPLAEALGIEVAATHRALPDAETCARVFCALFKKLCAHAPTVGDAIALLGPRRAPRRRRAAQLLPAGSPARRPPERRPDLRGLTSGPGVYVFRDGDGHPLYVGKSVNVRTRARQHFTAGAPWAARAEHVDCEATASELVALLLEHRLIRSLKPPGNTRGVRDPDGQVYLRCRLDIAFPILEVAREPAAGHAVCIGPVRGQAAALELVEQLNSLFGLRHCGRKLPRRYHPSAYGQMGRCLSPCLGDLDPNLYRERLEAALRLFVGSGDGGRALLEHVEAQMRAASAARRYERAAALRRRRARLESLLARMGGVLRAVHAGARLVIAPHPADRGRADAVWVAGGRVVDWAPLPAARAEVAARTAEALRQAPDPRALGGWLVPDELDEVRIVGAWLAGHEARVLELQPAPSPGRIEAFVAAALA
ncbi:MAG TPA: exonuclease domain-containing protein [Solirubrobacteraceae bacterium]|nr:exonuclease domain-containing protein [Solirubrobacteraceae bacterium]